jgi:hypothetical protein
VVLSLSHREVVAQRLLFDFSHAVGMSDARNFMKKMDLSFGPAGLSAGPVHFSYTGWAVVQLHDTCRPSPNDECYLYYDHPFSFESHSWTSSQVVRVYVLFWKLYVADLVIGAEWTNQESAPSRVRDECWLQQRMDRRVHGSRRSGRRRGHVHRTRYQELCC